MDIERAAWAVKHKLERVIITIEFPPTGTYVKVGARGESSGKRHALWTHEETFSPSDHLTSTDWAHMLALVSVQDRPANLTEFNRSLRGGVDWEEPHLLF